MIIYRRRKNDPVWHWRTDCRHWPQIGGYIEFAGQPERGKFCKDCHDKYENGECSTLGSPLGRA